MTINDYETSLNFARKKYAQLTSQFPHSLQLRENYLLQKLQNSSLEKLKKLELFYSEMEAIYEFIHKFTACKKGCNYCCHYEIAITDIEVEYIKNKVKIKKLEVNSSEQSCPFLKKGICSIYAHRPFICRRHLTITETSKWCKPDVCNDFEFPLINLSEIDKCYAYLVGQQSMDSLKDIRQAFR
jgi:Fe-S-cluster containining protein